MIPKIIIWQGSDRDELLNKLDINIDSVISADADGLPVDDFRYWINNSINIVQNRPNYKLLIWSADELSWEAQAVLLKPLEELQEDLLFYLIVKNESSLADTIISRCVIEKVESKEDESQNYWGKVMDCWKKGPAECILFSDTLDKEAAEIMVKELIAKMRTNLLDGISDKRLAVLDETVRLAQDLKSKNINLKLATGDYLLRTWKLIKT